MRREENATRGMAIYHLHSSYGSRQNGQSALAKARYLLRLGKYARGRDDLVDGFWGHLPDWCADDGVALFEAADRYERANARLFDELEGALPCELTLGQAIELALAMAHEVTAPGLPYLLVIHEGRPPAPGLPRNRHWHLAFLERINDGIHRPPECWFRRANRRDPAAGGAAKERSLKGHEWLPGVRRQYARLVNEALERAGHPERVTAASHAERIARAEADGDHETAEHLLRHPPGLHIGPTACAIERGRPGRPGRRTERGDRARARAADAAHLRAELEPVESELNHLEADEALAADRDAERVDVADGARLCGPQSVRGIVRPFTGRQDVPMRPAERVAGSRPERATSQPFAGRQELPVRWGVSFAGHQDVPIRVADRRSARRSGQPFAGRQDLPVRRRGAVFTGHQDVPTRVADRQSARRSGQPFAGHQDLPVRRRGVIFTGSQDVPVPTPTRRTAPGSRRGDGATARASSTDAVARQQAVARETRRAKAELEGLEADLRKTSTGGARLDAALRSGQREGGRELTIAERKSIVDRVAKQIREELTGREQAVAATDDGAALLSKTRRTGEDGTSPASLADHERRVEQLEEALREARQAREEAERRREDRRRNAEAAASGVLVDIDVVYRRARAQNEDALYSLEQEIARATPVVAAARAARLDDAKIKRIHEKAESDEHGSGWAAVSKATEDRNKRRAAAEVAAGEWFVDADAVRQRAREQNEDELAALEREITKAKPVVAAAWAAGLDDAAIKRIRDEAESNERGSGWAAVSKATEDRNKRRAAAEVAAAEWFVDADAVRRDAGDRNKDDLFALEEAIAEAEPVVAAARAAGLDDAAIKRIRDEAESNERGSGWAAVSKATEDRNKRRAAAEVAAAEWFVDADAVRRDAQDRNEDDLVALQQAIAEAEPVVAAARAAGLDDAAIKRIRDEAESNERGSGWAAVSKATENRNKRRAAAEVAAAEWFVDADAVRRDAGDRNKDDLDALEEAIAEAEPVVAAARAAGLDDAAIKRIRDEAESNERGSGWAAVSKATENRNKRRAAAEAAAAEWFVDADAVRRDAQDRNEDDLDALEEAIAKAEPVVAAARAAGLDDATIRRIRDEAESNERGSGWAAVSKATEDRNKRRAAAEVAAGEWFVDAYAVRRDAGDRNKDDLDALEEAIAEAKPVVAAARAAGLDDATIRRIRDEAESNERGSGWAAVSKATENRNKRRAAAEVAAAEWFVDAYAVRRDAGDRNEDDLAALEREITKAKPVVAAARAAGLDDAAIKRIRDEAESNERGSGWAAVSKATENRNKRRAAAEVAAAEWFVDAYAVRRDAGDRNKDDLDALEEAIAEAKPVVAAARAAGLDDAAIKRIRDEAESNERGSGWAAVSKATEDRNKRRAAAEVAAAEWFVDADAVRRDAGDRNEDDLAALEREIAEAKPVVAAARAAGLDDAAIKRIRDEAESNERGSGWAAVSKATEDRNKRRAAAEVAAAEWFVDADAVRRDAGDRNKDDLDALEEAIAEAEPVVAAARAAGLDDATIRRIRREAQSTESGSGWAAVAEATQEFLEARRELAAEEQRKRAELADLTAEVRETSAGTEQLDETRRAQRDTPQRSLTLDEEIIVVNEVKAVIERDLARRARAAEASPGGGELLRRVERRRGGPHQRLAEREETMVTVELRVEAAAEAAALLTPLAPDPERPDRSVPPVINTLLDAVPADDDDAFVEDVVWLLQARFAQAEQKGSDRGGYDAEDREKSARRHFGGALASAFVWCVLKIRTLILTACHKVLGGRGETGARVQAALETTDAKRQSRQLEAHEEARTVVIDPNAFSEEARANGRDEVAAITEETARRRQVISDAAANDIDVQEVLRAAKARGDGSGFSAIEAAVERHRKAVAAAQRLRVDVDAVCAAARSKGEDPVAALQHETARRTKVELLSDFIGLSGREFKDIFRAAEEQCPGSGYTAIEKECIRRHVCELVRKELPFDHSGPGHSGTWALALSGEGETDLRRRVQGSDVVHDRLSEVMAASPGSPEERQGAERRYHRPEIERELQELEAQRGWLSAKPTEDDALQVVLKRFIPELAGRVRAACAGIADLDRSVARIVEDDWVRRVVNELPAALPSARPYAGGSSSTAAYEGLNRIAAATDDGRRKKVIVAYQKQHDYDAGDRQRAENALLERRRSEEEASGEARANAEAAAHRTHEAELLRILQEVCRRVQPREFERISRERVHDRRGQFPVRPAVAHSHRGQARARPDQSQGRGL